jgi:chromosome segregation ATPase
MIVGGNTEMPADVVTKIEFNDFCNKITGDKYKSRGDENVGDLKETKDDHAMRIASLEGQIELLKKMNAPSDGSGGEGLLDVLNDITDKMRKEFQDKLDDLAKRIEEVDTDSKERDSQAVITMNDHEGRLKNLEDCTATLQDEKADKVDVNDEINRLEKMIEDLGAGKPVEVRAASAKSSNVSDADIAKWNKAADLTNKHEALLDKLAKDMDILENLK